MVRAMKRGERGRAGRPPGSSGVVPSMRNGRSRKPQQSRFFRQISVCTRCGRHFTYITGIFVHPGRYQALGADCRCMRGTVCALGGFRTRELIQNRTEHARDATRTRARAPSTYARGCPRSTSFRIGPMKATLQIGRSMSSAALVCRSVSGQIHHQSHPSPSHHPDRRPLVNRCDPHTLIHRGQPRPTFRPPARRREHSRRGQ